MPKNTGYIFGDDASEPDWVKIISEEEVSQHYRDIIEPEFTDTYRGTLVTTDSAIQNPYNEKACVSWEDYDEEATDPRPGRPGSYPSRPPRKRRSPVLPVAEDRRDDNPFEVNTPDHEMWELRESNKRLIKENDNLTQYVGVLSQMNTELEQCAASAHKEKEDISKKYNQLYGDTRSVGTFDYVKRLESLRSQVETLSQKKENDHGPSLGVDQKIKYQVPSLGVDGKVKYQHMPAGNVAYGAGSQSPEMYS